MKLYYSHTSPFARKVRVLIREKGELASIEEETISAMDDPAALHEANPLGKIPALILKDGTSYLDSPLICAWLDAHLAGPSLVPTSGEAQWKTHKQHALADGIMEAAVSAVFERNRPKEQQSEMWLGRWLRAIDRSLTLLESEVTDLDGPVDIGVIATGVALGYLDFRHSALNWQARHPQLAGWWQDIAKRPSFVETSPPTN